MSPAATPLWLGLLLVALGGALGGVLRYVVSGWVGQRVGETFPWGTLVVNTSGALMIGLLAGAVAGGELAKLWLLLAVGVLGSYTTVSSLSLQALLMVRDGGKRRALVYVVASLGFGLPAVWLGYQLGSWLA